MMEKLIGVRWGSLSDETKKDLLDRAFYENIGDCIIDLTENLSVAGKVIDTDEERIIEIDDNEIIYNPCDGILDTAKESVKFEINDVLTVSEAAEVWNLTEGAIRKAIASKKFIVGVDYRKAGRITLITRKAMETVYGKLKTEYN